MWIKLIQKGMGMGMGGARKLNFARIKSKTKTGHGFSKLGTAEALR